MKSNLRRAASDLGLLSAAVLITLGLTAAALHLVPSPDSSAFFWRGVLLISFFTLASTWGITRLARRALDSYLFFTVATASLALSFFIIVPVTVERSLTRFLIETMADSPNKAFTDAELTTAFKTGYLCEGRAIRKRLYEQTQAGNVFVAQSPDGFQLTKRGSTAVWLMTRMGRLFRIPLSPPCSGRQTSH